MGLAARYVSGYIETVAQSDQEQLVGTGASHAWVSVYLPDIGWIDFDPTNNQIPSDRHIIPFLVYIYPFKSFQFLLYFFQLYKS